jgi:hypothetical protein
MKGVVFNLLEAVVTAEHGAAVWDDLLDAAGVSGAYTSLGNYDDAEIEALAAAAANALSIERNDVLRWFGQKAIPVLAGLYPDFFKPHDSAKPFVRGVNDIIHTEVRKLYVGAACPHFGIREHDDRALSMTYRSARRMCALAQGFIEGAAAYYCEEVELEHLACVDDGDAACEFRIQWPDATDRAKAA